LPKRPQLQQGPVETKGVNKKTPKIAPEKAQKKKQRKNRTQ